MPQYFASRVTSTISVLCKQYLKVCARCIPLKGIEELKLTLRARSHLTNNDIFSHHQEWVQHHFLMTKLFLNIIRNRLHGYQCYCSHLTTKICERALTSFLYQYNWGFFIIQLSEGTSLVARQPDKKHGLLRNILVTCQVHTESFEPKQTGLKFRIRSICRFCRLTNQWLNTNGHHIVP